MGEMEGSGGMRLRRKVCWTALGMVTAFLLLIVWIGDIKYLSVESISGLDGGVSSGGSGGGHGGHGGGGHGSGGHAGGYETAIFGVKELAPTSGAKSDELIEVRNLTSDFINALYGRQMLDLPECAIPVELFANKDMRRFSFKQNVTCPTPLYHHSSVSKGKLVMDCSEGQYRKGFTPHLFSYQRKMQPYALVNDTEVVITMCHWVHEQLFAQNIVVESAKERAKSIFKRPESGPWPKLNVNLILLDGCSRPQFNRAMKKTANLLEQIHNNRNKYKHEVFQFLRYTVQGRNSDPNLTPMVSGYKIEELEMQPDRKTNTWLWDIAKQEGYVSLWADEQCHYSLYLGHWQNPVWDNGTDQIRTDHRFGSLYCHWDYQRHGQYAADARCIDGRQAHTYQLDYIADFYDNYRDTLKFSFSIFYESHEPTMSVISASDQDLHDLLSKLLDEDDNTVHIIIADHGLHYGPYLFGENQRAGLFEHKLPVLDMIVPDHFLKSFPEAEEALLEKEQTVLTSTDVYTTIKHLLSWPNFPPFPTTNLEHPHRGRSLLQKGSMPPNRSCVDAGVPKEFCMCTPDTWTTKFHSGHIDKIPQGAEKFSVVSPNSL